MLHMYEKNSETKSIDFALRQGGDNSFILEVYRPRTNVFGYTKYHQTDQMSNTMNKSDLKKLADFIYKFIN